MQDKRGQTCCFTGHRHIPTLTEMKLSARLKKTLTALIAEGYLYFGVGGALGFDTLAAKAVLSLKKTYPDIRLILVLPCETQSKYWKPKDVAVYEDIKRQADKVVCLSKYYTPSCMHERNRHLVDASSVCVAYLTEETGGTAYTVAYAQKKNVRVINLA